MLSKPIVALHVMNFSSCRNYWGGGGKTICLPPQYFNGGRLPPPPPRIDASVLIVNVSLELNEVESRFEFGLNLNMDLNHDKGL